MDDPNQQPIISDELIKSKYESDQNKMCDDDDDGLGSYFENNIKEEQKKIDAFLEKCDITEKIKLKEANTRNMIIVGRTRSGKTTFLNILKDPTYINAKETIFTETRDPTLLPFTVECALETNTPKNFNLNIIDTPGLFEVYETVNNVRENEEIRKAIATCLKHEITKIHAIIFLCSFTSGVNSQDIESFSEFVKLFKGAENNVIMVISHCEEKTNEEKKNLLEEVVRVPQMEPLLRIVKERILFTGSLASQSYYKTGNSTTFMNQLRNVRLMRQKIFKQIFSMENPAAIEELEYFQKNAREAEYLYQKIKDMKKDPKELLGEIEKYEKYRGYLPGQKAIEQCPFCSRLFVPLNKLKVHLMECESYKGL